jgi:hypothetical protein
MPPLLSLLFAWAIVGTASASFWDAFVDDDDGWLDLSDWMADQSGFVPIPIIVTEPAVGLGGGAAALFVHPQRDTTRAGRDRSSAVSGGSYAASRLPPSSSVVAGLVTENGTWGLGGGHFGSWRRDRIRYEGAVVKPSLNLQFYGAGLVDDSRNGIDYNLSGWYVLQELAVRVAATRLFLGGHFSYQRWESRFEIPDRPAGFPPLELTLNTIGIGPVARYDSRDNTFTPNRGIDARYQAVFSLGVAGTDVKFNTQRAASHIYWPLGQRVNLGWRADGRFSGGDTPFYALPFIQLRGIPALRYQDRYALMTELEARVRVISRWSVVGFSGLGWAIPSFGALDTAPTRVTGGFGLRYLLARRLGLHTGIDVARGPDQWAFYLQMGSAWLR